METLVAAAVADAIAAAIIAGDVFLEETLELVDAELTVERADRRDMLEESREGDVVCGELKPRKLLDIERLWLLMTVLLLLLLWFDAMEEPKPIKEILLVLSDFLGGIEAFKRRVVVGEWRDVWNGDDAEEEFVLSWLPLLFEVGIV